MNKIIILTLSLLLFGLTAYGQQTTVDAQTKKCIPTKECAEKMGMTLAECKAKCKNLCGSANVNAEGKVASATAEADIVSDSKLTAKKSCCASIKACAKKEGMTVAECKAKCTGLQKTANMESGSTEVAAASAEAIVVESSAVDKKPCCKGKKKCSKK